MPEEPLEDLFARLKRERRHADGVYNDALLALEHAFRMLPALPAEPRLFQPSPPPVDTSGGMKAAVRGVRAVLWRILGSSPHMEHRFHDLVEHAHWSAELRHTLAALLGVARSEARFVSLLVQYLQTITPYVDTRDRQIGGHELSDRVALVEQRLMVIKRDLEARPGGKTDGKTDGKTVAKSIPAPTGASASREAFAGNVDSATYAGFEDRFRGAREDVRRKVEDYVPLLAASSSAVVEVGCGRGELLELLRASGVSARGVDVNHAMVERCRIRGLDVEESDALAYLDRQPDGAVGGLVAIQVVEHFEPGYLAQFLETAYHKMRPGAALILETINPACWAAFFDAYIRDLTHKQPLHPDTLRHLVEASGFTGVNVQFREWVTEAERLDRVTVATPDRPDAVPMAVDPLAANGGAPGTDLARIAAALNAHADKLNPRLFSSRDYAVIARR